MKCKVCGALKIKGKSRKIKRNVYLCTHCGRADYIDIKNGRIRILWPAKRYYKKAVV